MSDLRRILALDPATVTGFCWSDGTRREYGTWHLPQGKEIGPKLAALSDHIYDVSRSWGIDEIAFELASFGASGRKGEGGVQWSTIVLHNQLRGVIEQMATELKVAEVWRYGPSSLKLFACFSGRAKKDQVMRACRSRLGITVANDNESDAIWLQEMARERYVTQAAREKQIAKRVKAARKKEPRLFY